MTTGPEPASPAPITAALLVARIDDLMVDAVTALADQSRAPDGILLLDATATGELPQRMAESAQFTAQLPNLSIERVATDCSVHDALRTAMAVDSGPGAVWLLSGDSVPAQDALEQLAGALEHDPTAALAAPKLLDVDRPGRLRRFGIQTTRSGRLQLGPRVGVPDQQQYDDRMDALAAPALGALFDREAYADLGGPLRSFGALGNDLDYGWRAQLAGHRVLLVPRARISVRANQIGPPTGADRRDARRVALARRPLLLTPFLALWIALSSLAVALGLLLLKRPAAAGRTAADLAALAERPGLEPVGDILSANPGLPPEQRSVWESVWFKGGSEPGVLVLAYRLTAGTRDRVVFVALSDPRSPLVSHPDGDRKLSELLRRAGE